MIFFIICAPPCAPPIAGGQLIGSPASTGARNVATHLAGRRRIAHPVSRHPSRPVCLMNINSGSVTGGSVTSGSVTFGSFLVAALLVAARGLFWINNNLV